MIAFWIAAALLSAASAGLIMHRAARESLSAARPSVDPALAVYRRQLGEVDALAERGLLDPAEIRSTRAEAARWLLSAADAPGASPLPTSAGRRMVTLAAALTPLAALAVYMAVGAPGTLDQPFKRRVTAWRQGDPARLDPPRLVAVLQEIVAERPKDNEALAYLARAQAAAGDTFSAERTLQKALQANSRRADLWTLYGELITTDQTSERLPDDARMAFRKALAVDPNSASPRYFLARDRIARGDLEGGLTDWKALRQALPGDDPRSVELDQEIASVERTHALPAPPQAAAPAQAGQDGAPAFIRAMVQRLAARLQSNPDDPAGWARLVRAYAVLGDAVARDGALSGARSLFKDRPRDLAPIEAAAR